MHSRRIALVPFRDILSRRSPGQLSHWFVCHIDTVWIYPEYPTQVLEYPVQVLAYAKTWQESSSAEEATAGAAVQQRPVLRRAAALESPLPLGPQSSPQRPRRSRRIARPPRRPCHTCAVRWSPCAGRSVSRWRWPRPSAWSPRRRTRSRRRQRMSRRRRRRTPWPNLGSRTSTPPCAQRIRPPARTPRRHNRRVASAALQIALGVATPRARPVAMDAPPPGAVSTAEHAKRRRARR